MLKIMNHAFRWAFVRCLKRKYRQVKATPQGNPISVGTTDSVAQRREHLKYLAEPELKENFTRARVMDDTLC